MFCVSKFQLKRKNGYNFPFLICKYLIKGIERNRSLQAGSAFEFLLGLILYRLRLPTSARRTLFLKMMYPREQSYNVQCTIIIPASSVDLKIHTWRKYKASSFPSGFNQRHDHNIFCIYSTDTKTDLHMRNIVWGFLVTKKLFWRFFTNH